MTHFRNEQDRSSWCVCIGCRCRRKLVSVGISTNLLLVPEARFFYVYYVQIDPMIKLLHQFPRAFFQVLATGFYRQCRIYKVQSAAILLCYAQTAKEIYKMEVRNREETKEQDAYTRSYASGSLRDIINRLISIWS